MKKMFFIVTAFTFAAASVLNVAAASRENLIHLKSVDEFDDLKAERMPMVVKVYAEWCGPCKAMKPIVVELAQENPDVLFVNIDGDNKQTAPLKSEFGVSAYPTFIYINAEGQEIKRKSGSCSKQALQNNINEIKGGKKSPAPRKTESRPEKKTVKKSGPASKKKGSTKAACPTCPRT